MNDKTITPIKGTLSFRLKPQPAPGISVFGTSYAWGLKTYCGKELRVFIRDDDTMRGFLLRCAVPGQLVAMRGEINHVRELIDSEGTTDEYITVFPSWIMLDMMDMQPVFKPVERRQHRR